MDAPITPQQPVQTPPTTPTPDGTEKMLSALGYVGFLCILPLVLRKDSAFCQYHGKQGLILAIFDLIIRLFTVTGWFYTFLLVIYYAIIVYSLIRSYKGEYFTLPMISDIAKEIKL